MALIKCPGCGQAISVIAVSCPSCGYPLREVQAAQDEQSRLAARGCFRIVGCVFKLLIAFILFLVIVNVAGYLLQTPGRKPGDPPAQAPAD